MGRENNFPLSEISCTANPCFRNSNLFLEILGKLQVGEFFRLISLNSLNQLAAMRENFSKFLLPLIMHSVTPYS